MFDFIIKYTKVNKIVISLFLLFIFCVEGYADDISGVLVVSDKSDIKKIKIIEVRKIFLGLPAKKNTKINRPIINASDIKVYSYFLKKIMRMSEKSYKRKLIKRVFRQGSERIKVFNTNQDVIRYLHDNPNDITFMSEENANASKGVKVIQRLW